MEKKNRLKSVLASVLVTAALCAPILVLSSGNPLYPNLNAELVFQIEKDSSLVFHDDGTVQLLVNVAVDKAVNCRGTAFHLSYNPDYLTPSNIVDNKPLNAVGQQDSDEFFREDKDLFTLKDSGGNPVETKVLKQRGRFAILGGDDEFYSQVDVDAGTIDMNLWFDNEAIFNALDAADGKTDGKAAASGAGKLTRLAGVSNASGEGGEDDRVYVFNKQDENTATNQTAERVVLGQLSFQVAEGRLAEIIDLFDGLDVTNPYLNPAVTPARPEVDVRTPDGSSTAKVKLLDINQSLTGGEDPWQVGYYAGDPGDRTERFYAPDWSTDIAERYIFAFNRDLIVDVALTNPDFTINAYQNFTDGSAGDLRVSMGRWANMVTVTYADGRKENKPFPWGASGSDYSARYIKKADLKDNTAWDEMTTSPISSYDPTASAANPGVGTDYIFTQKYQIYETNADGTYKETTPGSGVYQVAYTFPIPVTGHMRVTPITVLSVTAEDLSRTYPVSEVLDQVKRVSDLDLPAQARIITDIVPGSVSLVTPIKGWTPIQPDSWTSGDPAVSTWPTGAGGTAMNALKAKSYVTSTGDPAKDGYPYWPDADNAAATDPNDTANYAPDHFVGEYWFETAASNGGTAQGILKTDIQADFPWLTVPKDSYAVDNALRKIVKPEDYADTKDYVVKYVKTVTKNDTTGDTNGNGQPTLTLSVAKASTGSMAANSVFRVWLPNGLELGTGQDKGGVAVDNWFNDASLSATDPGYNAHVNGFYNTEAQTQSGGEQFFHLNTNPSDPAAPVSTATADYHNDQRETLRRYINLGGWYYVAICEDPDAAAPVWTDPIPVYVPPRPNEYQESKVYNFVGENQGLFNWPGGVSSGVMAFPQGSYTPVAPELSDTSGKNIGLPLYDVYDAATQTTRTTNAVADPGDVFQDGNPYLLKSDVKRHEESYGVETTYDGQTGAQPGTVFTVKVDVYDVTHDTDWRAPTTTEETHRSVAVPSAANPVASDGWATSGDAVTKNGATPLYDNYRVTGFGTVNQPAADTDTYRATLRTQLPQEGEQLVEKVTLTAKNDPDPTAPSITRAPTNNESDNVTVVTFNTVTEGYTVRVSQLLTINNVGDVDIYGLDIDSLVDGYDLKDNADGTAPAGGHFEITMQPASFLPAGSSTNFILTYVYDLRANQSGGDMKYRDTLYITSTSHPDPGVGADYLLDFDAELTVSDSPLHQVTVIYRPANGTMGTAGLIVGEQVNGSNVTMNATVTTRTYPETDLVYVEIQKVDEYEVKSITAELNGTDRSLDPYGPGLTFTDTTFQGTAAVDKDKEVYVFEMPNHDVTVYVDFFEPTRSKLRLDHLIDFSAPNVEAPGTVDLVDGYDPTDAYQPSDPGHIYKVWKKQFTGSEAQGTAAATGDYAAAKTWSASHGNADENYYLMTAGSAIPATQGGDVYDSSHSHYLVVIDAEDDFSQLKAQLRNVKYHVDYRGTMTDTSDPGYNAAYSSGYNLDIEPTVNMTLYYKDQVLDNWKGLSSKAVYDPAHGYGPYDSSGNNLRAKGSTADSTYHISGDCDTGADVAFDSPLPGESAYVDIAISYTKGTTANAGDESDVRHYYVEIHRRTAEPEVVLHYGNAPYGMIMNEQKFITTNDDAQTAKTRAAVKDAFLTGYTFRGADASVLPDAAKGKLQSVTYWREAWVRNLGLFEPESLTGFHAVLDSGGDQVFSDDAKTKPVYAPDKDVYDEADNLDLNDYAFFAILGHDMWEPGVISAKDSSGRAVSLTDIHARALDVNGKDGVTLLDTGETLQVKRFSGTDKAVIDLGVAGQKLTALSEHAASPVTVGTNATLGVTQWPAKTTVTTTTPAGATEPVTTTTHTVIEDIRPGRYLIEYSYYDFDGVSLLTATRPFVILRDVGDVNADGKRNAGSHTAGSDEYAIEDRVTKDPLGYEAGGWDAVNKKETVYPYANIFKFRVADVNNDRNINNIDANQVAKNVKDKGGWLQFYDPVDYGHPGSPITAPASGS